MIYRHFAALALTLSVTLSACGGSGDSEPAPTTSSTPVSKVLVIGNSLALHPPAPDIGWTGNWGMAASEAAKDYPHVTASTLGATLQVENYSLDALPAAERPAKYNAAATANAVVVVQLAENLAATPAFITELNAVLQAVKTARSVVCVGSWWPAAATDSQVQSACTAAGAKFIAVSDLKDSPMNADKSLPPFAHAAVNEHPRDWGMAQIAARITAAAK